MGAAAAQAAARAQVAEVDPAIRYCSYRLGLPDADLPAIAAGSSDLLGVRRSSSADFPRLDCPPGPRSPCHPLCGGRHVMLHTCTPRHGRRCATAGMLAIHVDRQPCEGGSGAQLAYLCTSVSAACILLFVCQGSGSGSRPCATESSLIAAQMTATISISPSRSSELAMHDSLSQCAICCCMYDRTTN